MKFSGKVGNEPSLGGDPDHGSGYADPDPYRDTGKTCLGRGMHFPSASSYILLPLLGKNDRNSRI